MDEAVRQLLLAFFAADDLLPPDMLAMLDLLTAPDPTPPTPAARPAV